MFFYYFVHFGSDACLLYAVLNIISYILKMKGFTYIIAVFAHFMLMHTACARPVANKQNTFDEAQLTAHLKSQCVASTDSTQLIEAFVRNYYASNNFRAMWVTPHSNANELDSLFVLIENVGQHGLPRALFCYDKLKEQLDFRENDIFLYDKMARVEYYASLAFLQYVAALQFGVVQAQVQLSNYYFATQNVDVAFLAQAMRNVETYGIACVGNYMPSSELYKALLQKRAFFAALSDSAFGNIPLLPDGVTIKHNTQHPTVALVAERLKRTQQLPNSHLYASYYQLFDDNLLDAVNVFQREMGLLVDKEIGNSTLRTLNFKPSDMVAKIDANLERLRWKLQQALGAKHIVVNVPEMQLRAYNADTLALQSLVCVGRPRNRTPMLQSNIYELVLNPTWTIPNSIIVNEISKTMQRDTSYIRRMRMRIYYKNEEVRPQDVDWARISRNYQPYIIVQDSGDINALGRIKFNFANRHSVYLHDTNSKSAFLRYNRAVSHGCVRVQKPLELAFFCLAPIDETQKAAVEKRDLLHDKIRHSIDLQPRTKIGKAYFIDNVDTLALDRVRLRPSVPLLIEYVTARILNDGSLGFLPDIYEMDAELSGVLTKLDNVLK